MQLRVSLENDNKGQTPRIGQSWWSGDHGIQTITGTFLYKSKLYKKNVNVCVCLKFSFLFC